ncbi:hypothetical protein CRENBAI_008581 [Crenichthys baileyi]|uniref:Uncharacterized protein n=1 Tax=Crenichthys baileyi TaxID=28760 RepID=A0AAV9SEH1_9TELE
MGSPGPAAGHQIIGSYVAGRLLLRRRTADCLPLRRRPAHRWICRASRLNSGSAGDGFRAGCLNSGSAGDGLRAGRLNSCPPSEAPPLTLVSVNGALDYYSVWKRFGREQSGMISLLRSPCRFDESKCLQSVNAT